MKRTTIFVDDSLETDLKALARRQGRPMAELVREGLSRYVAEERARSPVPGLSFIGVGRSGRGYTSERHEELLWRDLQPHGGLRRRARRQKRTRRAKATIPKRRR